MLDKPPPSTRERESPLPLHHPRRTPFPSSDSLMRTHVVAGREPQLTTVFAGERRLAIIMLLHPPPDWPRAPPPPVVDVRRPSPHPPHPALPALRQSSTIALHRSSHAHQGFFLAPAWVVSPAPPTLPPSICSPACSGSAYFFLLSSAPSPSHRVSHLAPISAPVLSRPLPHRRRPEPRPVHCMYPAVRWISSFRLAFDCSFTHAASIAQETPPLQISS